MLFDNIMGWPEEEGARARPHRVLVERRCHRADPNLVYYLHRPAVIGPDTPVIVSVHGISRNAGSHAEAFAADEFGRQAIIVAPLFDEERFADYQRLGRRGRGARADLALDAILSEVAALTGLDCRQFFLHGYSGGAQFAHRFALAYPDRVRALAVCAAGWYTMPDPAQRFPHGTGTHKGLADLSFRLTAFLRIPILVLVGDKDTQRDASLNRSKRIDSRQGATRVARAENWVEALREASLLRGLSAPARLELLPGCAHSFEDGAAGGSGIARRCADFFKGHAI